VAPCAGIAFITHLIGSGISRFDLLELLWTFSIYLESIAILPQLIVLQRYREVENLTGNYILFMGAYRAFYILNWIYRSYHEPMYQHHFVVYFCGVLQTVLYADFFYYYFKSKQKGGKFTLPTSRG
jgi:ER lumen protein retaining receptor